jgi:hypothetical protein
MTAPSIELADHQHARLMVRVVTLKLAGGLWPDDCFWPV